MFENVVVGVHDSEAAYGAVSRAMEVTRVSGGTLHLVMAYKIKGTHYSDSSQLPEELRYSLGSNHPVDRLLHEIAVRAQEQQIRVMTHPVTGVPAEAIARVAKYEDADLIVVGQNAKHRGRRKSRVSSDLVDRSSCAILVV